MRIAKRAIIQPKGLLPMPKQRLCFFVACILLCSPGCGKETSHQTDEPTAPKAATATNAEAKQANRSTAKTSEARPTPTPNQKSNTASSAEPKTPTPAKSSAAEKPQAKPAETSTASENQKGAAADIKERTATGELTPKALKAFYKEAYCAQRRGDVGALKTLYTEHGFQDPKAWSRVWTEAAKDTDFMNETVSAAMKACP